MFYLQNQVFSGGDAAHQEFCLTSEVIWSPAEVKSNICIWKVSFRDVKIAVVLRSYGNNANKAEFT